jgi:hypothetical protein
MIESTVDPIYKTEDGRIFSHQELLGKGYNEDRIKTGIQNNKLLKVADTTDPELELVTSDNRKFKVKDLLAKGYSQERIDLGVSKGALKANVNSPTPAPQPIEQPKQDPFAQPETKQQLSPINPPAKNTFIDKSIEAVEKSNAFKTEEQTTNRGEIFNAKIEDTEQRKEGNAMIEGLMKSGINPYEISDALKGTEITEEEKLKIEEGLKVDPKGTLRRVSRSKYQNALESQAATLIEQNQADPQKVQEINEALFTVKNNIRRRGDLTYGQQREAMREGVQAIRKISDNPEKLIGEVAKEGYIMYFGPTLPNYQTDGVIKSPLLDAHPEYKYKGADGLTNTQTATLNFLEDLDYKNFSVFKTLLAPQTDEQLKDVQIQLGRQERLLQLDRIGYKYKIDTAIELRDRAIRQDDANAASVFQTIIEGATEEQKHLEDNYPLVKQMENRSLAKDLENFNSKEGIVSRTVKNTGSALKRAGNIIATAGYNTVEGVIDIAGAPFRSEQEDAIRQLSILGGQKLIEDINYLPVNERTSIEYKYALDLKAKNAIDAINNSNLSKQEKIDAIENYKIANDETIRQIPVEVQDNKSFGTVMQSVADMATNLTSYMAVSTGLGSAGVGRFASEMLAGFATMFHENLAKNIQNQTFNPYAVTAREVGILSLAMAGAGTAKELKAMAIGVKNLAVKDAILSMSDKALQSSIDATFKSNAYKAMSIVGEKMVASAKSSLKINAALTPANLINEALAGNDIDIKKAAKDMIDETTKMFIFEMMIGVGGAFVKKQSVNEISKVAVYEAAKDPESFKNYIDKRLEKGLLTKEEHTMLAKNIDMAAKVYEKTPKVNAKGKPLTDTEARNLMYWKIAESKIEEGISKDIPEPLRQKMMDNLATIQDNIDQTYNGTYIKNVLLDGNPTQAEEKKEPNTKLSVPIDGLDAEGVPMPAQPNEEVTAILAKSKMPLPKKDVTEMTAAEVNEYAAEVKTHQKETALTPEQESQLTTEQADEYYGKNLPEGVYDPKELQRIANRVLGIEEAKDAASIAEYVKRPLIDYARKQDAENLAVIKAAKRKEDELGLSTEEFATTINNQIKSEFGQDAEAMAKVVFDAIKIQQPKLGAQSIDIAIEKNAEAGTSKNVLKDDKGNDIDFYHSTPFEFEDFDMSKLGANTNSLSAKEGIFFSDNKNVAESYRQQAKYDNPNIEGAKKELNNLSEDELIKLAEKILANRSKRYYEDMNKSEIIQDIIEDVEKDIDKGAYQDRSKFIEKIQNELQEKGIKFNPYVEKGKQFKVKLKIKNPFIYDAKENYAESIGLAEIIKQAKKDGHDGVIVKNVYDSISFDEKGNDTQLSNIAVVFEPSQILKEVKPTESVKEQPKAETPSSTELSNNSKVVVEELKTKKLTTVPNLGMGAKEADGMYISTEKSNRYATENNPAKEVSINIENPKVTDYVENTELQLSKLGELINNKKIGINDISEEYRQEIGDYSKKELSKIKPADITKWHKETQGETVNEDLFSQTARTKAAKLITEQYQAEGYDSLYLPASETQEGLLVVFDRGKVNSTEPKISRQEKINNLVDLTAKFNNTFKNKRTERADLSNKIKLLANELGVKVNDGGGTIVLRSANNKKIQKRNTETNKTESATFDESNYDVKTKDIVSMAIDNPEVVSSLYIKGDDGVKMSIKQIEKAVADIKSGKITKGAESVYNRLQEMVDAGEVKHPDMMGNEDVNNKPMTIDEWVDSFKKDKKLNEVEENNMVLMPDEVVEQIFNEQQISESDKAVVDLLVYEGITKENLQGLEPYITETYGKEAYETINEFLNETGSNTAKPEATRQESVISPSGEKPIEEGKTLEKEQGGQSIERKGLVTEQDVKELQKNYDKAQSDLSKAQDKLANEQGKQADMFAGGQQKELFSVDAAENKTILDPLRQKVKEAKAELEKAQQELSNQQDRAQPALFEEQTTPSIQQQDLVIKQMALPYGDWLKRLFTSNRGLPGLWMVLKDAATGERQYAAREMRKAIANLKGAIKLTKYTDVDIISKSLTDINGTEFQSLPTEVQAAVKDMRLMVDGYSESLVNNGLVTPAQALTINDHIGEYLNRSYKLYTVKDWVKKIDKKDLQDGISFLTHQRLNEINADQQYANLSTQEKVSLAQKLGKQDAIDILQQAKDTQSSLVKTLRH